MDALSILELVDQEMYKAYKDTKLPEAPDFHTVNNFLVTLYSDYLSWIHNQNPQSIFKDLEGILKTSDILKQVKEFSPPTAMTELSHLKF